MDAPKKRTALVKTEDSSVHDGAARFFALHGMKKIGEMLGDTLSSSEEEKAQAQMKEAQQKMSEDVSISVPDMPHLKSVQAPVSMAPVDDSWMDDEDDEAEKRKKQWAQVDALRRKG